MIDPTNRFTLRSRQLLVLVAVVFLVFACWGAFSVQGNASLIQIEQAAEIGADEITDFQRAAVETTLFFQEQDVLLKNPVTIVLTRGRAAFITESARRFKVSEFEVNRLARGVDALAGNGLIVVNVDAVPTARQRTFLLAHELTHHYQRQLAGLQAQQVKWMLEGTAEAVGAAVVSRQGFFTVQQYKDNWFRGISQAGSKPALGMLRRSNDWATALSRYGSGLTYKTAGLGVLMLMEQQGQGSVIAYFAHLGSGVTAESAFEIVFGLPLADFESQLADSTRKVS